MPGERNLRKEHPEWIDDLHEDLETIGALVDAIQSVTSQFNSPRSLGEIEELVRIAVRLYGMNDLRFETERGRE